MTLFQKKLVAVLNKNKNVGVVMNALAHMSIGLGANHIIKEEFRFTNYKDASGNDHKNISEMPFIVLEGNSNKIRELRHSAIENEVEFVDYTNTMTEGTYKEQIQKSFQTKLPHFTELFPCGKIFNRTVVIFSHFFKKQYFLPIFKAGIFSRTGILPVKIETSFFKK